jgi:hypothetical protein
METQAHKFGGDVVMMSFLECRVLDNKHMVLDSNHGASTYSSEYIMGKVLHKVFFFPQYQDLLTTNCYIVSLGKNPRVINSIAAIDLWIFYIHSLFLGPFLLP